MGSAIKHITDSFTEFFQATIVTPLKDLSDLAVENGHGVSVKNNSGKRSVNYLTKAISGQKDLTSDYSGGLHHSHYYMPRC